ncbi:MAG: hypothetical protein P4M11_04995 [Candidatus Pacebacteria bacterium]|nr:hypothetical protein [Candidatus Paceibacterota bacterium]
MTDTPITSNQDDQLERFTLDAVKKARTRKQRTKETISSALKS